MLRRDYIRKDGSAAVNLQVIINRKKKVLPTNIFVKPADWDDAGQQVRLGRKFRDEENLINVRLHEIKSRAVNILQNYNLYGREIDIKMFEREFTQADRFNDFITYVNGIVPTLNVKPATKVAYRVMVSALHEYRSEVTFAMLTPEFLREFEHWLKEKRGLSNNTINCKYHKNIQKFIKLAIAEDIPVVNPYEKFRKSPTKTPSRDYLDHKEINNLIQLYNSGLPGARVLESLAAFLFSCLAGGYRISEIKILTDRNILGEEIVFESPKTDRTKGFRRIKLTDAGKAILDGRSGRLFDMKYENYVNQDLKKIAHMAGISKRLSFHIARHTFAMQYLMNGGKVENLMHILGHSKIDTTMRYVHMHDELVNQKMHLMNTYLQIKPINVRGIELVREQS